MPAYPITLRLPDADPRPITMLEAPTLEDAASIVSLRFPFLPPDYVWVGDRALTGLLAPPVDPPAPRRRSLTLHRERSRRQKLAERWRQHWIDKDEARRKGA